LLIKSLKKAQTNFKVSKTNLGVKFETELVYEDEEADEEEVKSDDH
jgi:hypothetical protein